MKKQRKKDNKGTETSKGERNKKSEEIRKKNRYKR